MRKKDVSKLSLQVEGVWAKHKLDCGKFDASMSIPSPDPKPVKQYRFPKVVEPRLLETVTVPKTQEVLINTQSIMNSLIWPAHKSDRTMWKLPIDLRRLNKVMPALAPVVLEGLASITHRTK